MAVRYKMRNDNILIRVEQVEKIGHIIMPEASYQGKRFVIEEVGPDVHDLKKGDVVFLKGEGLEAGKDYGYLPNSHSLIQGPQRMVVCVLVHVPEEEVCLGHQEDTYCKKHGLEMT